MGFFSSIFGKRKNESDNRPPRVFFTNTLSGNKELFISQKPNIVTMYSCGPTVYSRAHIGNLRAYVFSDTIFRTLNEANYHVRRVINITDVGHLVSNGDTGEDKMAVGASREHTTPEAIAERYTKLFTEDIVDLHIVLRTDFILIRKNFQDTEDLEAFLEQVRKPERELM